jgi:hypothetical protein
MPHHVTQRGNYRQNVFESRREKGDTIRCPLLIEQLISMKKAAWRPIDQADIAELKILKKVKRAHG